MGTKAIVFGQVSLGLAGITAVFGFSSGPPLGTTGAPSEGTCVACHVGGGSGSGRVQIIFPSATYTPGERVRFRVVLQDPDAVRWGFQLTARSGDVTSMGLGVLASVAGGPPTQTVGGANATQFVMHTAAGTQQGTRNEAAWEIDWTAPPQGAGPAMFYVAANAANGNGNPTGDRIYSASLRVNPAPPPATSFGSALLPQFAFGGGWYSALYFASTREQASSFAVRFFGSNGAPLATPGAPGGSLTVNLDPRGASVVEAPDTGPLQQGWATFDPPEGVVAYGVFRQTVAGRPDQEAVVPLATNGKRRALLVFDNVGLTTAVAVVNPGASDTTITVTARDPSGQILGTRLDLALRAGEHLPFVPGERPELRDVAGRRGTLEFAASSGGVVAALGLRFGVSAFTSIPVVPLD